MSQKHLYNKTQHMFVCLCVCLCVCLFQSTDFISIAIENIVMPYFRANAWKCLVEKEILYFYDF